MCIIVINGEEPIKAQVAIEEPNLHQTTGGKSKVNISLCIRKSYQRTYLEDIYSIFDQFRTVVSHIDFFLPDKPLTPKKIGEALKGPQRKFWK